MICLHFLRPALLQLSFRIDSAVNHDLVINIKEFTIVLVENGEASSIIYGTIWMIYFLIFWASKMNSEPWNDYSWNLSSTLFSNIKENNFFRNLEELRFQFDSQNLVHCWYFLIKMTRQKSSSP